ncbi:MAG: RNA polymerase sigma factor [Runella sp.]
MSKIRNNEPLVTDWSSFKQGDRQAFERIYRGYVQVLYRYGRSFTEDEAMIMDSIHDLFADLWQKRDRLGDTDNIKFYLLKALKHRLWRSQVIQSKFSPFDSYSQDEETQEKEFESNRQMEDYLPAQLSQLTERQREIIHLRFYENLSHQQIAELLQINPQSAKNLLHRTIEALRDGLKQIKLHHFLPFFLNTLGTFS